MASNFIGINRGQDQVYLISASAGSPSKDIELRIDTGKGTTRLDVVKAMRIIEIFIENNGLVGANLPPL